ncbi:MAG: TonB-dependent receptor [Haliscomenobacteraceae bacterium CHB4]|nr:Vitamin B12 transporter BtuB [Saprospiraceae bacterium]MCE7922472.1 TonB-dependent receptor [Haliscomenobacteraceae bacterium CHB4]
MKKFFIFLFGLFYSFAHAQKTGGISGMVTAPDRQPVEFASVFITLQSDTSRIVEGMITDSLGRFLLTQIPFGDYFLNVQFIGYEGQKQAVSIGEGRAKVVLSAILLTESATTLCGVEVSAIRNLIRKTEEGIVLNAADNLTQIGGSAADLLKNMPGVIAGGEGEITLRGKTPLILINGRVSGIGGADRTANLEQIPAGSIERIEIITNPSSKYDADAEGGIINLVLKKSTDLGTNGAVAAGAGFGERYRLNGTLLLNHKTPKWNFGVAYDNWYTTRTRRVRGDRVQFNLPDEYYLTQRRFDERILQNQSARMNIDFSPNEKNSLNLEAIWLFQGEDNNETLTTTTETTAPDFTGRNRRHSNEIRHFHTVEALLEYARQFGKPDQSLTFRVSSAFDNDRENTLITTQELLKDFSETGEPYLQKTHNYENSNLSNLSLDYAQPVGKNSSLETGYKAIFRFLDNDFLRQNETNGSFVTDPANTDVFNFREQIHAAYVQYGAWVGEKKSPDWKFGLGLRAEQVWNNGDLELNPLQFKNDYFNLFPSAQVIRYTARRDMVKLSYGRRINRPSFGQLIPFTDITDSLNTRAGNPELNPELAHSLELSYSHAFGIGNFNAAAFYRRTSDVILPFTTLSNTGVAFTKPLNFGNATTFGLEGMVAVNPTDFWSLNLNVSGYDLRIENSEPTLDLQRNQWAYFAKLIQNFTPWKGGKIQLTANYTSPIAIPQGERLAVYFVDLGFQQKVWKGKGRLGLALTDIFDTQRSGLRLAAPDFDFQRSFKIDSRAALLTFTYSFRSQAKEELLENKFKND